MNSYERGLLTKEERDRLVASYQNPVELFRLLSIDLANICTLSADTIFDKMYNENCSLDEIFQMDDENIDSINDVTT